MSSSEPCSSLEPCNTSLEPVRQEGLPWVRLVLSLLLLGAPALVLALDTTQNGPYLAGSFDQLSRGGQKSSAPGIHLLPGQQLKPLVQEALVATPWRVALRHIDTAIRTLTQVYHWVQAAPFSHGRVIDPARYLQRTLR